MWSPFDNNKARFVRTSGSFFELHLDYAQRKIRKRAGGHLGQPRRLAKANYY
jgi:hypothetical protein